MAKDPRYPDKVNFWVTDRKFEQILSEFQKSVLTEDALKRVLDARGIVEEKNNGPKFSWLRLIGLSTVMYMSWRLSAEMYELFFKKQNEIIETSEKKLDPDPEVKKDPE